MPTSDPPSEPSRDALLAEVAALRRTVATLQQERDDLEVMLEMATEHADHVSETLQQERDDLETVLEMTTEHGDALEEELQNKARALEERSQFIRDTFGRYISDDVVAQLLDAPDGLRLGGEKCRVTVLMSDLRGFTALAERLDPQQVVTFLNRYLEAMVPIILSYGGTIIEILGDALLVIFGAPLQHEDDAQRAVACAVAMQLQMEEANAPNRREGLSEAAMGIGIHTGDAVVGNFGSQQRARYGAVGGTLNLTGRIESYTTGGQILISDTTYQETAALVKITHQMTAEPKGISAPITLYAVNGIGGTYALYLPDDTTALVPLPRALPVRCRVLEEKFVGSTVLLGSVVRLSPQAAELHLAQPAAVLSNLTIQLMHANGAPVAGELLAKVVSHLPASTPRVVVRFTFVPPELQAFLDAVVKET